MAAPERCLALSHDQIDSMRVEFRSFVRGCYLFSAQPRPGQGPALLTRWWRAGRTACLPQRRAIEFVLAMYDTGKVGKLGERPHGCMRTPARSW